MLPEDKPKILFLLNNFDLIPSSKNPSIVSFVRRNVLFKKFKIKQCVIDASKNEVQKKTPKHVKERKRESSRIIKNKMRECCKVKRYLEHVKEKKRRQNVIRHSSRIIKLQLKKIKKSCMCKSCTKQIKND